MRTLISSFFYTLPEERIAQTPIEPRDASRLLVLDRVKGDMEHREQFSEIVDELNAGDVLVFNVSKVFKARLIVDGFEVFVLKVRDGEIDALVKGSRKLNAGSKLGDFEVVSKTDDGIVTMRSSMKTAETFEFCDQHGSVPTPPYVKTKLDRDDRYQTVYARSTGSVAAPTAGLHFTPELIERIRSKGVRIEHVTLHVGIGTFRPVQTEHIEDHIMHAEYVEIDSGTAERINQAKTEGRRVIAVGTTTVRVLEGVVMCEALGASFSHPERSAVPAGRQEGSPAKLGAFSGELNIFITPGFQFRIVDAMITNFHLPKSTLLMLVSAFAGRENVLAAYREAIERQYRFFSFGDAMFIR